MGIDQKLICRITEFCSKPAGIKEVHICRLDYGGFETNGERYMHELVPFCEHGKISGYALNTRGSQQEATQKAKGLLKKHKADNWAFDESDISELPAFYLRVCDEHREPEDVLGLSLVQGDNGPAIAKKQRYEYTLVPYCKCGVAADFPLGYSGTNQNGARKHAKWLRDERGMPPLDKMRKVEIPRRFRRSDLPLERSTRRTMLTDFISKARRSKDTESHRRG